MRLQPPSWFILLVALVLGVTRGTAAAEDKTTEARRLYSEATAAFGLGNYAEAAEKYEGSFKLHPDAALLYNAAQAYRMAGNQTRALQLYRNFIRLYGDNPRAPDARTHVAALEKGIAETATATPAPPPTAAPIPAAPLAPIAPPPATPSLAAPAPSPEQPPALVVAQSPQTTDESTPLVRRPWFWVAVGAVVVGGTVAALLATRKTEYPSATLGTLE
jgi:tetratricopeptide (TPR) repeat protein